MVAGVEIYTALGRGPQLAMAMGSLGSVEVRLGRPDVGRELIEKAVAMARDIDDEYGAVGAYFHLGYLELDVGTREKALTAFLAGLDLVEPGDTMSTSDQVAGIACAIADKGSVRAAPLRSGGRPSRAAGSTGSGALGSEGRECGSGGAIGAVRKEADAVRRRPARRGLELLVGIT